MRASSSAGGRIFTRAAASSMASGSPSSRRQISTTASAFFEVSVKVGPACRGPLHEQCDRCAFHQSGRRGKRVGIRERQGRDRELLLAVDMQHEPAGHENLERGTGVEQLPHEGGRIGHLLEIVHEQERRSQAAKVVGDPLTSGTVAAFTHAERERNGRRHEPRVGDRRKVHERDAALELGGEIGGDLNGEARFPCPAWSGQRQQPNSGIEQQALDGGQLGGPSNQGRALRRKIVIARLVHAGRRTSPGGCARKGAGGAWSAPPRFQSADGRAVSLLLEHAEQEPLEHGGHVRRPLRGPRRRA